MFEATLAKELESTAVVRFQDCDPFRHLNNARYVDYFMNAREDQLAQFYGFSIFGFTQQTNHAWVVTKTQIAYLAPATINEQVIIRTQLVQLTDNVLVVEGVMLDEAARRLKSVCWIEFVFIDLASGRPVKHPDEFTDRFRPVVVDDVYAANAFNARVDTLKVRYRKQRIAE